MGPAPPQLRSRHAPAIAHAAFRDACEAQPSKWLGIRAAPTSIRRQLGRPGRQDSGRYFHRRCPGDVDEGRPGHRRHESGRGQRPGLCHPALDAGRTEADEREQTNTEELRNLGRVGGLADAKPSFGPAPGGAGGGGAGSRIDHRPAERPRQAQGQGFAKDYAALDSALAAGDNNEIIFTDRLDDTQRQVEKVLLSNGIAPVPAKDAGVSPKKARQANENFYTQNRPAAGQVQYEVFVTPEQK